MTEQKFEKATNLPGTFALADGAIVLHVSVQRRFVYVKASKNGRPVRRRYRHDQLVAVEG
jgi:hypothetical protein